MNSGWEKVCTACHSKHFPRTDPVVIMLVCRENKTLLGRSKAWPQGMFSCLAGFMEPGESIEVAVARETYEEAGINVQNTRYIKPGQKLKARVDVTMGEEGLMDV